VRTTIRLDDDLLREAKVYAAAHGLTLTQLVEDALRETLARRRRAREQRDVELPTSGAGGVRPGIDISDSNALWDLLDGIE